MFLYEIASWLSNNDIPRVIILLFSFVLVPLVYYLLMWIFMKLFGKKYSFKRFFLDRVAFSWPFHHLALAVLLFYISIKSELIMKTHFEDMGYQHFGLFDGANEWIIIGILILAVVSSIYYLIESRFRHFRKHNGLSWMTEVPAINWFQGFFASIVCFLLVVSGLFVLFQWGNLFFFFNSGWVPTNFLSSDSLFTTGWIRDILINEFILIILFSFDPLVLTMREKKYGSTKQYIRTFFFLFPLVVVLIVLLIADYNSFLSRIKETLLLDIMSRLESIEVEFPTLRMMKYQSDLVFYFNQITHTPDSVDLPTWLEGMIGLRTIVFVIDIINLSTDGLLTIPKDMLSKLRKSAD